MNFQIYLSGRVQKVFKLKPKNIEHDSKVDLSQEWIDVWRCEHYGTDPVGSNAFIFTNMATYFVIVVGVSKDAPFGDLLFGFGQKLMAHLVELTNRVPSDIQFTTQLLRGNPKTLIGVMNQQVFELDSRIIDQEVSFEEAEIAVNCGIYGAPNYKIPYEEFAKFVEEHPPITTEMTGGQSSFDPSLN